MPARQLDTSITDTTARRFLDSSPERISIWCNRITGLHLLKTKRGGSWRYRYQDALGRRRTATIGRYPAMKPQEAAEKARGWRNDNEDVLAAKEEARRDAERDAKLAENRILGKYLEGPYAEYQERKRAGGETLRRIRHAFAEWLQRDMSSITRADVREWQMCRESQGRAHETLKRDFGALRTLLRHAARQDPPVLAGNPLEGVSLERPTDDERTQQLDIARAASRRMLTDVEIRSLHKGLSAFSDEIRRQRRNSRAHGKPDLPDLDSVQYPHWFVPFAYCALYTGMRPGDLYSLTWHELNINFGRLVKVPEKTRHHPAPARVVLDLPEPLLEVMRAWWEQHSSPDTGLVFPSPRNDGQMDKKAHLKPWSRVRRLGALPGNLDFYALRHHFISALVSAGVPVLTIARLVGHKSASMIENNYGHLCPTASRDALTAYSAAVARKAG